MPRRVQATTRAVLTVASHHVGPEAGAVPRRDAAVLEHVDEVSTVAGSPGLLHVHYVDLRGLLSNDLTAKKYEKSWDNELHPTDKGFRAVAERFDQKLKSLP
jgi:hypothetical protein